MMTTTVQMMVVMGICDPSCQNETYVAFWSFSDFVASRHGGSENSSMVPLLWLLSLNFSRLSESKIMYLQIAPKKSVRVSDHRA